MEFPANLVSSSPLVQDTFDFVTARGGRARMSEIADAVLRLSDAGDELSMALVSDLISNDRRFAIENASLSISKDHSDARPLREIDFVVMDVEAVSPKPARIIEL